MNVLDLAIQHGLSPKKATSSKGGEFASSCPFCGGDSGRSDRFRIWPDQNSGNGSYWCRQCGAHGDRIQFVMDTRKVGFKEACRMTGDTEISSMYQADSDAPYRINLPIAPEPAFVPKPPAAPPALAAADIWSEKAMKLVEWSASKLKGSDGETVLMKKGIVSDDLTVRLGWIPEDIFRPREAWGLETVLKPDTGKPKRLWIPKGIVIPYLKNGRAMRIRIRRPEGEPRYYVLPGSSPDQMILGMPGRSVVVVESELDAILIDQVAGDITAVIALGTARAKPDMGSQAVLKDALCILVALDFDEPGQASCDWWQKQYPSAIRWPVPSGKDPSDAAADGKDLRSWVIAGWPVGWQMVGGYARADRKDHQEIKSGHPIAPGIGHPSEKVDAASEMSTDLSKDHPVFDLYNLMRKNRKIRIIVNSYRMSLQIPDEWGSRNQESARQISNLVYFNSDVFDYLHHHGEESISCTNLIQ